jgi:hypothetical protein
MNAKEFNGLLLSLMACSEAVDWAEGKDWQTVYETCERGDWLLWLLAKTGDDHRLLTLAKARCAETVLHLMKDERSKKAVEVAIKYGNNEASKEDLRTADAASYAAASYAAAYYAANAYAASYAAAYYAAYAAAYAADAADAAAAAAAYYAASDADAAAYANAAASYAADAAASYAADAAAANAYAASYASDAF